MKWEPMYSLGIEEIDKQHKKIIEMITKLEEAQFETDPEELIKEVLVELEEYTKYHFKTEEKYFKKFNYVDKEEHEEKHKEFISRIKTCKVSVENEDNSDHVKKLLTFLEDWLVEHIMFTDTKYQDLFIASGVL